MSIKRRAKIIVKGLSMKVTRKQIFYDLANLPRHQNKIQKLEENIKQRKEHKKYTYVVIIK